MVVSPLRGGKPLFLAVIGPACRVQVLLSTGGWDFPDAVVAAGRTTIKTVLPSGDSKGISPPPVVRVTGVRAHRNLSDQTRFFPVTADLTVMPPAVTHVEFTGADVPVGGSFIASFAGPAVGDSTYIDVRVRRPGRDADEVIVNWQRGRSASHAVPVDTELGIWTITGVRPHDSADDHSADFTPVSATLRVYRPGS
jgi:hypothetical protein